MFWKLDDFVYSLSHNNLVTATTPNGKSISLPFVKVYKLIKDNIKASNFCSIGTLQSTYSYGEGRDVIGTKLIFNKNIEFNAPTITEFDNVRQITLVFSKVSSETYYQLLTKKIPLLEVEQKRFLRGFVQSDEYRKMTR